MLTQTYFLTVNSETFLQRKSNIFNMLEVNLPK